jgi:hypothetical protein
VAHPQVAVFDRLSKGGEAPRRLIFGQATRLSRTMHDIRYHEKRDEVLVTNPFAQAILMFKGDADKDASPIRIIQGPKTMLGSEDTLEVDSIHDEILIPSSTEILVFPAGANGDVAPIRRPRRANPNPGWSIGGGIAVDNIHNVIATDGTFTGDLDKRYPTSNPYNYPTNRNTILMFDRLADGVVMPIRFIRGDKTGIYGIRQIQIYPKGGWIIVSQISDGGTAIPEDTFVGVWSIYDNGNVPPKWRINGTKNGTARNVLTKPRGVAFDAKHKEVLVSDMRLNAVLTFSFPEIFDQEAKAPANLSAGLR